MRKVLPGVIYFCLLSIATSGQAVTVSYQWQGDIQSVRGQLVRGDFYFPHESAKRHIRISTLNWPPYIGKDICQQGWVQQLTIALLHSQGYSVTSGFRPWARAVQESELGNSHILYPEYFIETDAPSDVIEGTRRREHLALSDAFPGGEIGFITRADRPLKFNGNFDSIKNARIGVVRGYQNTPAFDRLWDAGFFPNGVEAVDDLQLGKMLLAERLDIILGDPRVIRFTLVQSGELTRQQASEQLKLVRPVLQYNPLYYAVSKQRPNWRGLLTDINEGLAAFKAGGVIDQIRLDVKQHCRADETM